MSEPMATVIANRPGWADAIGLLRQRLATHGEDATQAARGYSAVYDGRRAAMVVDVVASRQRRYTARVLPMVERFQRTSAAASLATLAEQGCDLSGLRPGESDTMRNVAVGLLQFGAHRGLIGDNAIVAAWAAATEVIDIAHQLDPYVGNVKGIGPALFAYLRMRSGGDGIKPDLRVRHAMRDLGFEPPSSDIALVVLCRQAASELGIRLLILDQLLWSLDDKP